MLPRMPSDDFGNYLFRRAINPTAPWKEWYDLTGEWPVPMWRIQQDDDYDYEFEDHDRQKPEKPVEDVLREKMQRG